MGKVCWDFPLLGTSSLSGSNNAAITMFKGTGIMDGLAREVCQNSLDAKDPDLAPDVPVKVVFDLKYIEKAKYPMFAEYEKAVNNADNYWKGQALCTPQITEFINRIQSALNQDSIPVLIMSDYNTTGLQGVNAAPNEKSYWQLLVNTEGISIKQNENSAGSFGIGKNAPFAYSSLNMVFYNTFAKDGGRAFEGVTHLVTTQREYKGRMLPANSSGKYLVLENEFSGRPILPSDDCPLAKIPEFNRTETGTDVAVFGFSTDDYPDWEKATAVAVLKNFILAIMDGKLEVTVKSETAQYEIKKDSVEELLSRAFVDQQQLKFTKQIYETVTKGQLVKRKIAEKDDLSIYVRFDDAYTASLSRFRSTGMLINTTQESLPHYSVVIVVNDVGEWKLSKALRDAEPPQHTEWKAKNVTGNKTQYNRVGNYLRAINREIQKVLDEFEKAEITDKMDAGIGNYLPDASDSSGSSEGTDGLRTDIKINEISSYNGDILYSNQYESAESSTGGSTQNSGFKAGKRKRKRRMKKKIPVVSPKKGDEKGVAAGSGKVRIVTPNITDHRTYYIAANKYRLFVDCPKDYSKVFIQYFAGRDDESQDPLTIKNFKAEGLPRQDVHGETIGPISLKQGANTLYLEFENDEIMAVIPVFTMEVTNEKQGD